MINVSRWRWSEPDVGTSHCRDDLRFSIDELTFQRQGELQMLMGALVGAVLAVLGGLLGEGLSRFLKNVSGSEDAPKWPRVVGVALALSIGLKPTLAYINRPTPDSVMRELEVSDPMYAALKQKSPTLYAKIKADVETSLDKNDSAQSVGMQIRSELRAVYSQKLPQASNESLLTMAEVVRDEARSLDETDPSLCVAMLSEQGGDIASSLPDYLKKRETALLTQVITNPPVTSASKASEIDVKNFIMQSGLGIAKKLNVSLPVVGAAMEGKGSDHLRCQVSSELMDAFTKLPPTEAGPMIRAVMFSK